MPRYYAEAEKTTNELEQMFIDEISMQKDIKIISLMQTLGHKALSIVKRNATADVQEVRHGKWIKDKSKRREDGEIYDYCCSLCNREAEKDYYNNCAVFTNFCPHCGAKMDGGFYDNIVL